MRTKRETTSHETHFQHKRINILLISEEENLIFSTHDMGCPCLEHIDTVVMTCLSQKVRRFPWHKKPHAANLLMLGPMLVHFWLIVGSCSGLVDQ